MQGEAARQVFVLLGAWMLGVTNRHRVFQQWPASCRLVLYLCIHILHTVPEHTVVEDS